MILYITNPLELEGGSLDHRKADLEQNTLFEDITKHVITR